ncbi:hypothetical protein B7494_g4916 [Chlorociboria aeruginascens]|nr:hypothetical protein B7494_g4916 [Chlorociboria aeruginascens]
MQSINMRPTTPNFTFSQAGPSSPPETPTTSDFTFITILLYVPRIYHLDLLLLPPKPPIALQDHSAQNLTTPSTNPPPQKPPTRTHVRIVAEGNFTVEEMGESECEDWDSDDDNIIRPNQYEDAESDPARSVKGSDLDPHIIAGLADLDCSVEDPHAEHEAWIEAARAEKRRRRRSSATVQKRTISQSIGSDTDEEDLQPIHLSANEAGSSARRLRRKNPQSRDLVTFHDQENTSVREIIFLKPLTNPLQRNLQPYRYLEMNNNAQGQPGQGGQLAGAPAQQPQRQRLYQSVHIDRLPSNPFSTEDKEKWKLGLDSLWKTIEKNPPESQAHNDAKRKLYDFSRTLTNKLQQYRGQQQQQASGSTEQNPQSQGDNNDGPSSHPVQQQQQASRVPQISQKVQDHINNFPFTLPMHFTDLDSAEAVKWLQNSKQRYLMELVAMENASVRLAQLNQVLKKRNEDGNPLSVQEETDFRGKKEEAHKAHAKSEVFVKAFRKQQDAWKEQRAAAANGGQQQGNPAQQQGGVNANVGIAGQGAPRPQINSQQSPPNAAMQNTQTVNAAIEAARNQQMNGGRSMPQAQVQQMNTSHQNMPQHQGGPAQNVKTEAGLPAQINTAITQIQPGRPNNSPQSAGPQSATSTAPPRPLSHQAALQQSALHYSSGQASGTPNVMGHAHTHPAAPPRETQNTITNKMPIPKHLPERATAAPTPATMAQARPTYSGGPNNAASSVLGQPVLPKAPGYSLEGEGERVLNKKKLDELVRQVTGGGEGLEGGEGLTAEVEESILNLADNFVDQVLQSACNNAKERGSKILEIRDIQLCLERGYNIRIPGYASDEIRTVRKIQPTTSWISKMSAVQAAKVRRHRVQASPTRSLESQSNDIERASSNSEHDDMPSKTPHTNGTDPVENGINGTKDVEMKDDAPAALKGGKGKKPKEGEEEMTVVVPPSKGSKLSAPPSKDNDGDVPMDGVVEVAAEDDGAVKIDPVTKAVLDIKSNFSLLERAVTLFDARFTLRALRSISSIRKRLTPDVLAQVITETYPSTSPAAKSLLIAIDRENATFSKQFFEMDVDSENKITKAGKKEPKEVIPEIDIFLGILIQIYYLDNRINQKGVVFSVHLVERIHSLNRRTLDSLSARVFFYYSLFAEQIAPLPPSPASPVVSIRPTLLAALRTAVLRKDIDTQSTVIVLLLRNYLSTSHIAQADLLVSHTKFPESASNNQVARYLYYLGRIRAIQLRYTEAHEHLTAATRKAPSSPSAAGFSQTATKLLLVVELLMGDIPERATFRLASLERALQPYLLLVQAVRVGLLGEFEDAIKQHSDTFRRDGTFTLILRLRQNVIKTGIRMMSLSYSRISLRDICIRLKLSSEESAEYIVAKAIRDGVIEASLDRERGFMKSREVRDVYSTREPGDAFHDRIRACLSLHDESVKAMRFPMNQHRLELKNAQEAREREREMAKEIQDGDLDEDDLGGEFEGISIPLSPSPIRRRSAQMPSPDTPMTTATRSLRRGSRVWPDSQRVNLQLSTVARSGQKARGNVGVNGVGSGSEEGINGVGNELEREIDCVTSAISAPGTSSSSAPISSGSASGHKTFVDLEAEKALERNIDIVVFGDMTFKSWYPSWYPKEVLGEKALNGESKGIVVGRLYVCKRCFGYSKEVVEWVKHVRVCRREVPGRKVYVHGKGSDGTEGEEGVWSVWEVDGGVDTPFCQNLSLFAKLFLDNKSVFFDLSSFNYFLLVHTSPSTSAQQIVGFFSKEKMSWDSNNLACILIFPPWQRKCLGSILMGLSYEIARREEIMGGPEKPISDLGKKGYKRFWGAEIARFLLGIRETDKKKGKRMLDVESISKETWIAPEDCLSVLRDMGVVEAAGKGKGTVERVRIDKVTVREWVERNRINLNRFVDEKGFVEENYAFRRDVDAEMAGRTHRVEISLPTTIIPNSSDDEMDTAIAVTSFAVSAFAQLCTEWTAREWNRIVVGASPAGIIGPSLLFPLNVNHHCQPTCPVAEIFAEVGLVTLLLEGGGPYDIAGGDLDSRRSA